MKKQKLLKKRILVLTLSAAVMFAQTDIYAVLAAAPENLGEAVEYDESQTVLTEDLEMEDSGAEENESEKSEAESDSDTVVDEGNNVVSSDDVKETGETEEPEPSTEEPSEEEDKTAEINEDDQEETEAGNGDGIEADLEKSKEIIDSGTVNDISWSIDVDGLLTIEGTGDYVRFDNVIYIPPWANRSDVKSAKVNVSGITRTNGMFRDCVNLTSVDLSEMKTDNLSNMAYMFLGCSSLSSLNLSSFDTSKVTSMSYMFSGCSGLISLDVSGFDTSNVTSIDHMFDGCSGLISLDLSGFDTSSVWNWSMEYMFNGCSGLISLDISGFNTSKLQSMEYMFNGCSSLRSLDLSSFDTSNVTSMFHMFDGCSGLSSLDVSSFNTSKVTNMTYMFRGCSNLSSIDVSGFNTSEVTSMFSMFEGCSGLSSIDVSGFDTSKVTYMDSMFFGCSGLSSLDVSGFNTSKVTSMSGMFSGCNGLSSLDVSDFDTSKVTYMDSMFSGCSGLSSLDVSGFDTREVTSMGGMFSGCNGLSSLDVSSFNTSEVTWMRSMFDGCSSLSSLDVSGFDTSNVAGINKMFYNCEKLTILDLNSFDLSKVKYESSIVDMIQNCHRLSRICTPKNCKVSTELPILDSSDKWYGEDGTTYTELPTDLDYSIALYKNGYPDDGISAMKKVVFISGISLEDKSYDGTPISYTGTPIVKDSSGNIITDITLIDSYTGTHADGSKYEQTIQPPSQAGNYALSFDVSGSDRYIISQTSYLFSIKPVVLTIAAPSLSIETGDTVPELSSLTASVDGLLNGDILTSQPQLKYSADSITSDVKGNYDIIPYGADAGNNYSINYVKGTLTINGELILYKGTSGALKWKIDYRGKLTVKGIGDYISPQWCGYANKIYSAEIDVSGITTMKNMFRGCSYMGRIDLTNLDASSVTDMSDMFYLCYNLKSIDLTNLDTSSVTDMSGMFNNCYWLENVYCTNLDTSNVTNMSRMFNNCYSLVQLDLSGLNTGNVTDMSDMFNYCYKLKSIDLSNWDTGKVTSMKYMFWECNNLTSLDLSHFNTSNVTDMRGMFNDCIKLENLNISSFDTRKIESMWKMFYWCKSLKQLDLSSFDLSSVYKNEEYDEFGYPSILTGCDNLSYIRTPKNCSVVINLPSGGWYRAPNTMCNTLPKNLSTSIYLYNVIYTEATFISGISIDNMVYSGQSVNCFGTVVLVDSNNNKIKDEILSCSYTYTGTLADGSEYTETTKAPSEVGSYKLDISVESKGYSGQASYSFQIEPRTVVISAESVSIEIGDALPALTELSYTVSGLIEGDKLTVEPTLAYSENNISNTSAGRYGIIPSGAFAGNNYIIKYEEGTLTVGDPDDDSSFEMDERSGLDLSSLSCTIAPVKARIYNGTAYEPIVKVTVTENGKKKTLTECTDYRVLYKNNVNAGTGTVIVRGSGIYKGYKEAPIIITRKSVKKLKIVTGGIAGTISADDVNNAVLSLPVYVYDGSKSLIRGKDYTLTYVEVKKGILTVKITGMDGSNYTGETKAKIAVYDGTSADKIINPENINLESYTEKYTGKAIKPAVEVRINGEVISSKNYKVQYQNNKNAGTAYVIVTGKGAYKGKVVTAFEITVDTQKLLITNTIKAQTYKGKYVKPSVTVKAGKKKLKKNTDYTVTYKNNLHAGIATVTVTGKGNYSGTTTTTFTINPLKASKISVKGTWKDSNGDGIKDGGALTVAYGKRLLKNGVDYTLETGETKNNKIKVTLKGTEGSDFTGSVVKTLKME